MQAHKSQPFWAANNVYRSNGSKAWEVIKAGVGAGAGAIRIKAGAGALLFLSNYTRRFSHVI